MASFTDLPSELLALIYSAKNKHKQPVLNARDRVGFLAFAACAAGGTGPSHPQTLACLPSSRPRSHPLCQCFSPTSANLAALPRLPQVRGLGVCSAFRSALHPRRLPLDELRLGARGGSSWITRHYLPLADWCCAARPGVRYLRVSVSSQLGPDAPAARRVLSALLAVQPEVSGGARLAGSVGGNQMCSSRRVSFSQCTHSPTTLHQPTHPRLPTLLLPQALEELHLTMGAPLLQSFLAHAAQCPFPRLRRLELDAEHCEGALLEAAGALASFPALEELTATGFERVAIACSSSGSEAEGPDGSPLPHLARLSCFFCGSLELDAPLPALRSLATSSVPALQLAGPRLQLPALAELRLSGAGTPPASSTLWDTASVAATPPSLLELDFERLPALASLHLSSLTLPPSTAAGLASLSGLTALGLAFSDAPTQEAAVRLLQLAPPSLRSLELAPQQGEWLGSALGRTLGGLQQLTRLAAAGRAGTEVLPWLAPLKHLAELDLAKARVSAAHFTGTELRQLTDLKALQRLRLGLPAAQTAHQVWLGGALALLCAGPSSDLYLHQSQPLGGASMPTLPTRGWLPAGA